MSVQTRVVELHINDKIILNFFHSHRVSVGPAMHSVPLVLWKEPGPWLMGSSLLSVNRTSLTALVGIPSRNFRQTDMLSSISRSVSYGNYGCQGGNMQNTYLYIVANEGVASEATYPFKAKVYYGVCNICTHTILGIYGRIYYCHQIWT